MACSHGVTVQQPMGEAYPIKKGGPKGMKKESKREWDRDFTATASLLNLATYIRFFEIGWKFVKFIDGNWSSVYSPEYQLYQYI